MTILHFLDVTTAYFTKNGVDSPRLTAELMLSEALQKKRMQLYLEFSAEVPDAVLDTLRPLVKRRAQGEPLQYVQGFAEFRGDRVKVTPDVLIPRPETELLIEAVLPLIDGASPGALADVGTGSGILAKNMARAYPQLSVHAIDLSPEAIEVAKGNLVGLENVRLHQGHLLEPLTGISFQMIAANLPYLPGASVAQLSREVQREPRMALDGGEDGLDLIRELILSSRSRTRHLALEIGHDQAEKVKTFLSEHGYDVAQTVKDFSHIERIIIGTYRG